MAVAVLPDGRVVTGGYDYQVRLRNVQGSSPGTLIACYGYALATSLSPSGARLFVGHAVAEFHAGRYAQRHRTRQEPATCGVKRCNNRHEHPQGPV